MADADEAAGQDVEQKPAEEGGGIERGESGGVPVGAILPPEGDVAVLQRDEAIVGEGGLFRVVARQRDARKRRVERSRPPTDAPAARYGE